MLRRTPFLCLLLAISGCTGNYDNCEVADATQAMKISDSLATQLKWPENLNVTYFAGPDVTPSPACLAVAATGEVFAGVDMIGSLGKTPGKGAIIKLIDCNNDGVADRHTEFAKVDNPRGIIVLGDRVFVLHTTFSEETGKASGMDLVVFIDADNDGVADGAPEPLIQHISNPTFLQSRGTDHATNGIRMGIDGWIYIAVGDFGFHDAVDRAGTKLTMLGGGIVRVRPDGTGMEIYSHGMRNIYDVAIDPYMNIFTRGNTNDGGGWNVRFTHHIQSGEYGYPVLFKRFTNEIIPGLIDVGGGSGTGSLFMDDPTWPEAYNKVPMMADWGRSELYIHRVTPDGASFTQQQEEFIALPQITDLDVDGSGRLFLSAWDGAGYKGDSSKGFIVRAVPAQWEYEPFPDVGDASVDELVSMLQSDGAVARLQAQQELLARPADDTAEKVWAVAVGGDVSLEKRVAAIFTYAQITGENGIDNLVKLTDDDAAREFALRALADRKEFSDKVPLDPFVNGLRDSNARVRVAATVGLGRLGKPEAAEALLTVEVPASLAPPEQGGEGPHATPNSAVIPSHVAVRALVALNAVDACVDAVRTRQSRLGLWALSYMHDEKAVDGLMKAYQESSDPKFKTAVLTTLSRLYQEEAPYDGSWWWGTRPDTRGPYYKPVAWEGSTTIRNFLVAEWKKSSPAGKELFADLNGTHRMGIAMFGGAEPILIYEENKIDLDKIRNKKGMVGSRSIEDVMLALDDIKGDANLGKGLFRKQGCVACHSLTKGEVMKGPFMGQIGSIMTREQIAESILKPNASISQGFASVQITTKDGKQYTGFVSQESADQVVIRNIAGQVSLIRAKDIATRKELENSMMPTGLANSLSFEEFASLVAFLSEQKQ